MAFAACHLALLMKSDGKASVVLLRSQIFQVDGFWGWIILLTMDGQCDKQILDPSNSSVCPSWQKALICPSCQTWLFVPMPYLQLPVAVGVICKMKFENKISLLTALICLNSAGSRVFLLIVHLFWSPTLLQSTHLLLQTLIKVWFFGQNWIKSRLLCRFDKWLNKMKKKIFALRINWVLWNNWSS